MGASSSTSADSVTIKREVFRNYVSKHDSTVQELHSVKNRIVNLEKDLDDKQMKLNTESNHKNVLQKKVSVIRANLLKIEGDKQKVSEDLETTKRNLNELQIKHNVLSKTNHTTSNQLAIAMNDLIQTKNDLEKISRQLSEEIENNRDLELENKYRFLEESNSKLEKDLHENRDILTKVNTSLMECMFENGDLERACEFYEEKLEKLKVDLSEIQLKIDDIKLENKNLQISNTDLSIELKEVNRNRFALKEEISKKEKAISKHKNTIINLEDELYQYSEDLEELTIKLAEETVTDQILRKIIQIHRRIEELQKGISKKTDILVKKIKENDRDEEEKLIERLKSDYDNCDEKLALRGITINKTTFKDIYARYKQLCQHNDDRKKDILKQVYEIEKFTKDLRKRFDIFAEDLNEDVVRTEKSEKDLNVNLLAEGFADEKELYQDVLKIAKEEIAYRKKILQIDIEVTNTNDNRDGVKNYNILNNGKLDNVPLKLPQKSQDNSTGNSCKSAGISTIQFKGVVLFGAPYSHQSEYEDELMICRFLEENRIDYKSFRHRRFKRDKYGKRALVIEFTSEETVDKIMELGRERNWFLGFNSLVKVYNDSI